MSILDDILDRLAPDILNKRIPEQIEQNYADVCSRLQHPRNSHEFLSNISAIYARLTGEMHPYTPAMEILIQFQKEKDQFTERIPENSVESFYGPIVYQEALASKDTYTKMMNHLKNKVIERSQNRQLNTIIDSICQLDWDKKVNLATQLFVEHPHVFPEYVDLTCPQAYAHQPTWLLSHYLHYVKKEE